ncbi:hypothetical protein J7M28_01115 [bacterium]|nr:hypothetical protein [bacterium]
MNLRGKTIRMGLLVLIGALLAGCGGGGERFGKEIVIDTTTQARDILSRPDEFNGKTVRMEGEITRECPTGCWLDLKDETGVVFVDLAPSGLAIPQKVGSKIVIEGKVVKRREKTMIIAKGVEIK